MIENQYVRLYNFKKLRLLGNNLKGKNDNLQKQMEEKHKAVVQTYNNRLIDNKMVTENSQ